MKDGKVYPLFSKPVYVNNIDYDVSKIYSQLKKIKRVSIDSDSSEKFSSSSVDRNILNKKPYKEIRKHIEEHFYNYTNNVLHLKQEFKITTSWLTRTLYNEKSRYHNHNNCMYSGVLYLKTPKEKATISFQDYNNRRFYLTPTDWNVYNRREFFLDTLPGDIIIFPAEVFHKVNKNKFNEDRISLAFNFIPVGKLGDAGLDSYCEIQSIDL